MNTSQYTQCKAYVAFVFNMTRSMHACIMSNIHFKQTKKKEAFRECGMECICLHLNYVFFFGISSDHEETCWLILDFDIDFKQARASHRL